MADNSQTQASESRIIGKLEGVADMIQTSLGELKTGQENARLQLDAHAKEDRDYQERHAIAERLFQDRNAEALGLLRDRVRDVEAIADGIEGHGTALVNLEQRMTAREKLDLSRSAVQANNKKWIGVAGVAVTAGAAAGTGASAVWPKLWGMVAALFK